MGNNIDLGAFAQTVSSVCSGAQGLAKEQSEDGSHVPDKSHELRRPSFPCDADALTPGNQLETQWPQQEGCAIGRRTSPAVRQAPC